MTPKRVCPFIFDHNSLIFDFLLTYRSFSAGGDKHKIRADTLRTLQRLVGQVPSPLIFRCVFRLPSDGVTDFWGIKS